MFLKSIVPIHSSTSDVEFLAEACFALVLDCDTTLITPRVSCPGRVKFIYDCVFYSGRGVDWNVVPCELKSMIQVRDVVMTDFDLAV